MSREPSAPTIDLVRVGGTAEGEADSREAGRREVWRLGRTADAASTVAALTAAVDGLLGDFPGDLLGDPPEDRRDGHHALDRHFVLLWDPRLGPPPAEIARAVVDTPGDVWHAGLVLGQGGRPRTIDPVHPTWMLTADPFVDRPATSWRLTLRACLVRASVWRQLGGPRAEYRALDAAALELGHRWLWAGALVRHQPDLVDAARARRHTALESAESLQLEDALRFVLHRAGRRWLMWTALRTVTTRDATPRAAWRALRPLRGEEPTPACSLTASADEVSDVEADAADAADDAAQERVTVLVPTLDRYAYLPRLLEGLRAQTVAPLEIVVVDQTEPSRRQAAWRDDFADLPLRVLELERAGQSTARNAGLQVARGDVILFLDDDDEVPPDLLAGHLAALRRGRADVVCGVADEVDAGPPPAEFARRRPSDVFPTNNGSVRRAALERSGLFDLAFDHGARADAELGQRLYRSGAVMRLEPSLRVLHHRAPRGGLRAHKARRITYTRSRREIWARHLPSVTEIYLARVHFGARRLREMLVLRLAGTFALRGSMPRRLLKILAAGLLLPDSLVRIAARRRRARRLEATTPPIPRLAPETSGERPDTSDDSTSSDRADGGRER
ncbi:MAG: glycosyltransferase family 2 protein [Acidobacteriota bacterium]